MLTQLVREPYLAFLASWRFVEPSQYDIFVLTSFPHLYNPSQCLHHMSLYYQQKLVLFTCTIIEETKTAWYLIVWGLYIENVIFLGSEQGSFRKYNRRTLRGVALIDRFTPRGRSQAKFVDAENINGPILTHHCEMAWWNWKTCLGCPQSSESQDWGYST